MIDLTKPLQTRDGRPARVVSEKGMGAFPLIVVVSHPDGSETAYRRRSDGRMMYAPGESPGDLVNVPDHYDEVAYLNLGDSYSSKRAAQNAHSSWPVIELKLQVGTERGMEDTRKVLKAEVARA